jgi:hypothetical protein
MKKTPLMGLRRAVMCIHCLLSIITITILICTISCSSYEKRNSISAHDSTPISSKKVNGTQQVDLLVDFLEPDPKEVLKQYLEMYNDTTKLDTLFKVKGDDYNLRINLYCLKDSAITIPPEYLKPYHLTRFVTHNFAATTTMTKNDSTIISKLITSAEIINEKMDSELAAYGNLGLNGVEKSNDHITIYFNFAIPLTDIGESRALSLYFDGKLKFD